MIKRRKLKTIRLSIWTVKLQPQKFRTSTIRSKILLSRHKLLAMPKSVYKLKLSTILKSYRLSSPLSWSLNFPQCQSIATGGMLQRSKCCRTRALNCRSETSSQRELSSTGVMRSMDDQSTIRSQMPKKKKRKSNRHNDSNLMSKVFNFKKHSVWWSTGSNPVALIALPSFSI